MTEYRKKLIEVALPLEAINEASAREKSIRHGHPSTLHLWWARRPLAACRAVLFAQLVDDPSSVPEEFPDEAAQDKERRRLFRIVEELVQWKNSNDERVIAAARREIARSVARARGEGPPRGKAAVDAYLAEKAPPVVDPFCGGGSIPLEAQRLGLRAHGSDLNPVAVLITKALVEIPPRFAGRPPVNPEAQEAFAGGAAWNGSGAQGLAEDVRHYGRWMRDEAERRIGHLYPKARLPDGSDATVIAWLWARTVASPNPAAAGAHVPLVSSLMLSTKKTRRFWVEVVHDSAARDGWRFEVKTGSLSKEDESKKKLGTKAGKAQDFICALTGTPVKRAYIQEEGKAGRLSKRLMAVVTQGIRGRDYLAALPAHETIAEAVEYTESIGQARSEFLSGTTPTRAMITGGVCSAYGLSTWGHLFTDRQLVALTTFSDLVSEARARVKRDCIEARHVAEVTGTSAAEMPTYTGDDVPLAEGGIGAQAYADAVATYLGLCVSRQTNRSSNLNFWDPGGAKVQQVFARQALAMVWDFCESNPFSESSGNFVGQVGYLAKVVEASPRDTSIGSVRQADASTDDGETPLYMVATDPPYYDNIGYSDLSDFFYIWLRRSLVDVHPASFRTLLTPKSAELVATPYRFDGSREKAREFFENGFLNGMKRLRAGQDPAFPLTLYYAFKQAETKRDGEGDGSTVSTGWETMLTGVIKAGFTVDGTWPVRTELAGNLKKQVAALASSIVLACRPRPEDAPVAKRRDFASALKRELPDAIRRLQAENIAPVDLAQAAIGPGMAVFSRYAQVLEADGAQMPVRKALVEINRVLDETLAEAEGDMDADTRFCVAWFEQYGTAERAYGEAEVLFTAKNTSFEGLMQAGVLAGGGGKVRLKRRDELDTDWNPVTDKRVADWECVQHLVRAMTAETGGGVAEAARLAAAMGPGRAENARTLAYRLYTVSERKGWSGEALAYNVLGTSWSQIQAEIARRATGPAQAELDI